MDKARTLRLDCKRFSPACRRGANMKVYCPLLVHGFLSNKRTAAGLKGTSGQGFKEHLLQVFYALIHREIDD